MPLQHQPPLSASASASASTSTSSRPQNDLLPKSYHVSHILRFIVAVVLAITSLAGLVLYFRSIFADNGGISLFPSNFDELKSLGHSFHVYSQLHPWPIFSLYCGLYLWKQGFGIPGSALLNVLAGSLYGPWCGPVLVCMLTGFGSSLCYLLSRHFGGLLTVPLHARLATVREGVERHRPQLFYYLLFLRLFPLTPNWLINLSAPWIGIPLPVFMTTMIMGSFPYAFFCAQTGALLASASAGDGPQEILSSMRLLQLVLMAFVALLPALLRPFLQSKLDAPVAKKAQ